LPNQLALEKSLKIGHSEQVTASYAELIAIQQAMEHVEHVWDTSAKSPRDLSRATIPTIIAVDKYMKSTLME
jgi:hypothetical protein